MLNGAQAIFISAVLKYRNNLIQVMLQQGKLRLTPSCVTPTAVFFPTRISINTTTVEVNKEKKP